MPRSKKLVKVGRRRAAGACWLCHKWKMKCDISTHGSPCSRCSARNDGTICELYPSKKRGKPSQDKCIDVDVDEPEDQLGVEDCRTPEDTGKSCGISSPIGDLDDISCDYLDDLALICGVPDTPPPSSVVEPSKFNQPIRLNSPTPLTGSLDWLRSLTVSPASLKSCGKSNSLDFCTNDSAGLCGQLLVSRDNQGRGTFELSLNTMKHGPIKHHLLSFVGESCPLSMLVRRLQDSGHILMTSLPCEDVKYRLDVVSQNSLSPKHSDKSSDTPSSFLDSDSAVSKLSQSTLEKLLSTYFHVIHPFYPIINRREFAKNYTNYSISPLLLNAICFSACYHCETFVVHEAGYSTRAEAKHAFYESAKKLFDEDNQADLITVVQAAFLLSFFAGVPRRVWNSRSWLAVAVTVAEDMGMHRSTLKSHIAEHDKSHLRIIWWCMVVRDVMTSLTLGRPHKICELRCDVDLLTMQDFDIIDKDPENTELFGKSDPEFYHLLIELCKANVIMWKVFSSRYDPRCDPQSTDCALSKELQEWKDQLPDVLDWNKNQGSTAASYTGMIYHHTMVYIFRPRMLDSQAREACSLEQSVSSASEITAQISKLSVKGILSIPQDIFPLFITAMAILITEFKASRSTISRLQLQICMMALSQAREQWDHASWLLHTFETLLDDSRDSGVVGEPYNFTPDPVNDVNLLMSLVTPLTNSVSQ